MAYSAHHWVTTSRLCCVPLPSLLARFLWKRHGEKPNHTSGYIASCQISLYVYMYACTFLAVSPQVLNLGSITKRHIRTVACSAHSGDGLLDAFEWLVKDISSRIYLFGQ